MTNTDWPPKTLNVDDIAAKDWQYLAEGGKSLLLRYNGDADHGRALGWLNHNGTRALAIRLTKAEAASAHSDDGVSAHESDNNSDRTAFEAEVVSLLLSNAHLLPVTCTLPLPAGSGPSLLRALADQVQNHRPAHRLSQNDIDLNATTLDVVDDLTWSPPSEETLCIELKPKWLFGPLPFSRYRKHQVLRSQGSLTNAEFEELYEPSDLASGDQDRVRRAVTGLVSDWKRDGNNLRIFVRGTAVTFDDCQPQGAMRFLLQRCLRARSNTPESQDTIDTLTDVLTDCFVSSDVQAILCRLAHLQQRLAPVDIQTLASWWSAQCRGQTLGQVDQQNIGLADQPTINEFVAYAQDWLSWEEASQQGDQELNSPAVTLRQAVLGTLLSSTFKDCSLFFRITPTSPFTEDTQTTKPSSMTVTGAVDESSVQHGQRGTGPIASAMNYLKESLQQDRRPIGQGESDVERPYGLTVRLIDADIKPIGKLAHWRDLDQQIEFSFSEWAAKVGLAQA